MTKSQYNALCDTLESLTELSDLDIMHVDDRHALKGRVEHAVNEIKQAWQDIYVASVAQRDKFVRGTAIKIREYKHSRKDPGEWRSVRSSGKRHHELKLRERVHRYGSWTLESLHRDDGSIVSFPPGTIGFVVDEFTPTGRQSRKIKVIIDGWAGWADYTNFELHDD